MTDQSVQDIPFGKIRRDEKVNTRPVDERWVSGKMEEGFSFAKFGVPVVSFRGTYYVWLDGQNRGELASRSGVTPEDKITALVYSGLTRAEEAAIFLGLNDGRAVKPIHKFFGRVAAKEPQATDIVRILAEHGWRVHAGGGEGNVQSVGALDFVYELGGGSLLSLTFSVATAAWGHDYDAGTSAVVKGLAQVLHYDWEQVNLNAMINALSKHNGGPAGLYARGKALKELHGGTITNAVSEAVVATYNKGRRSTKLTEWRLR